MKNVPSTLRRVAGSALIAAGLTVAGLEIFTLIWQMGAPDQYELLSRGGNVLLSVLPGILLGTVAVTLLIVSRLTREHQLGPTQRFGWPGLAATLTGYLMMSVLALWVMVPIGLVSLPIREVITWLVVGSAVWMGMRLVRGRVADGTLPRSRE